MRPWTLAVLMSVVVLFPSVASQGISPTGPVEGGDFENPFIPRQVPGAFEGSAIDECIGIGHQAHFGSQSVPGRALGGSADQIAGQAAGGEYDPSSGDPEDAVAHGTEDPAYQAEYTVGYGHCEYGDEQGTDIVWLTPVDRMRQPATWSVPRNDATDFVFDGDENPFDREALIEADKSKSNLNLYQVYFTEPGVYTANFTELSFDVEAGDVPAKATFQLILSTTPLERQTPYAAGYFECVYKISGDALQPDEDGVVSADPLDGQLIAKDEACEDAVERFSDASLSDDQRKAVLGQLRIVQLNIRNFNTGTGPVVIDNVAMPGTTTFAEELADGNYNQNPDIDPTDV